MTQANPFTSAQQDLINDLIVVARGHLPVDHLIHRRDALVDLFIQLMTRRDTFEAYIGQLHRHRVRTLDGPPPLGPAEESALLEGRVDAVPVDLLAGVMLDLAALTTLEEAVNESIHGAWIEVFSNAGDRLMVSHGVELGRYRHEIFGDTIEISGTASIASRDSAVAGPPGDNFRSTRHFSFETVQGELRLPSQVSQRCYETSEQQVRLEIEKRPADGLASFFLRFRVAPRPTRSDLRFRFGFPSLGGGPSVFRASVVIRANSEISEPGDPIPNELWLDNGGQLSIAFGER